jgi:hypothetical protein
LRDAERRLHVVPRDGVGDGAGAALSRDVRRVRGAASPRATASTWIDPPSVPGTV